MGDAYLCVDRGDSYLHHVRPLLVLIFGVSILNQCRYWLRVSVLIFGEQVRIPRVERTWTLVVLDPIQLTTECGFLRLFYLQTVARKPAERLRVIVFPYDVNTRSRMRRFLPVSWLEDGVTRAAEMSFVGIRMSRLGPLHRRFGCALS